MVTSLHPNQPRSQFFIGVSYFYDAPTPSSIFDEFLAIPSIGGDLSTTSFSAFVDHIENPFLGNRLAGQSTE